MGTLGQVTRNNNIVSWNISRIDLEKSGCLSSPLFCYKGCKWCIHVYPDKKGRFAVLQRTWDEEPEAITVSFALWFKGNSAAEVEKPPVLNSTFRRGTNCSSSHRFLLEDSLNMAGLSIATFTCHFLEVQPNVEPQPKRLVDLNPEVDAWKKKFDEAQSTISKLRADINDLIEEKKSIMKEIENIKKLNKEPDQEVDALKKKFNEAQSTISKQKADIDVLIEEKKSITKKIENLEKLNKEPDLEALSADFRELLRSGNKSDVVLKVQGREFPAHSVVLEARSTVFRATFNHDSEEEKTGMVTIPDCDPESFPLFLNFLYSGRVGEMTVDIAQQLYATSDKYDVQSLKSICCDYLMHNLTPDSVCDVAVLADLHFDDGLASAAQLYFNENYIRTLQTSEWTATMKKNPRISDKLLKEMASAVGEKPTK